MSKSRDRYEDNEDNARPISTTAERGSSWSSRPMKRVKQVFYGLTGFSLFLYAWAIFFSERVSISNVSPVLLKASSILWLVAHRECELCPANFEILTFAFPHSGRRVHVLRAKSLQSS